MSTRHQIPKPSNRTFFLRFILCALIFLTTRYAHCQEAEPTQLEQYISSLLADIEQNNWFIDELTFESLDNLPVGIKKTIGNNRITIGVDSAQYFDNGIYINVFTEITLWKSKRTIAFAARNLLFTPTGISSTAASRLVMVSPQRITLSDQVDMILPGNDRNYVEWDCEGFRSVNLNGILEFSSDIFMPSARLAPGETRVQSEFEINASDLSNIMLSASITPFEIRGLGIQLYRRVHREW